MNRVKLGDLGTWGSGGTPLASRSEYYGGDIPWLIIEDLNDGFVEKATRKITRLGLDNSSAKIVPPGTLLIAMYGSIGKLGITRIECATNQAIAFCKCHPTKVDTSFLFHLFVHERDHFLRAGRGGTQQNISQEFLKDYEVSLPSLPEQRLIATLLDQADRLRRTRRYALELIDTFLPGVFIEMFGDPLQNPRCYKVEALGDLLLIPPGLGTTKPCEPDGALRCVRVGEVGFGDIDLDACAFVNLAESERDRFVAEAGDILLARAIGSEEHLGKLSICRPHAAVLTFDSHLMRLRVDPSRLLPQFLASMLWSSGGRRLFMRQARRTAVQFNVNAEQISALPIPLPPLIEQGRFVTMAERVERLRAVQREALRQADHLFASLLHRAFSD
jgi:type I restriction enzyme, S subunit